MCDHVSTACFIDVEANCLPADRTLCEKRVKAPSTQEFYKFHNPYEQVPHVHVLLPSKQQTNISIGPNYDEAKRGPIAFRL